MALVFWFGMALLLFVLLPAKSDDIPAGAHSTECRDCYFMMAVDVSFTGEELHFEAVDETGVYPITQEYSAECGYTVSVLPLTGQVELRASYFSCHTDNKDDEVFTFNFNLISNHEGKEVTYALNKTCTPSLPWSPREVICETNYIEVSVRSEVACTSGELSDDEKPDQNPAASDWQVTFHKAEELLKPMNLSEARKQGYLFDLTDRRIVFRTPYGQPYSSSLEVNGVPVEVTHATLFSRQSWVFIIIDLVASCSMDEGSYLDSGYMAWETPELLNPLASGLNNTQVNIGIGGELVQQPAAEERGYIVEKRDGKVVISIPNNATGGYRKSFVSNGLNEFYVFNLYLEQVFVNADLEETRLRFHRSLASPMLPLHVFTVNQIGLDNTFTVYLGVVPEDIELSAVELNGHKFIAPFKNITGRTVIEVFHPNNTRGFTLKVPFDDPVVRRRFSKEDEAIKNTLEVKFSLTVLPENETYVHLTSVMALSAIPPPEFDTVCSETGITFKLEHRPSDYLWHISIGSDLLTPELATQRGYILTNDSQSLLLEVPRFTQGYVFKDFGLKGFDGTFEILVKDSETSEVLSSVVKTCQFAATEFIVCSTRGKMTVMVDLSPEGIPATANLLNTHCGPKEADDTRALFSFPLNSCGSTVKLMKGSVRYRNEIFYSKRDLNDSNVASDPIPERLIVQCTYPLAKLHRLFSTFKFQSDTDGSGKIIRTSQSAAETHPTTAEPTTEPPTTSAAEKTTRALAVFQTARVLKVYPFQKHHSMIKVKKPTIVQTNLKSLWSPFVKKFVDFFTGLKGASQIKQSPSKI